MVRRFALQLALLSSAVRLGAQGVALRGIVYDSLHRTPLAGASVTLVTARDPAVTRATASDAEGRYEFSNTVPGGYVVGFSHPLLDSLGLEPVARRIDVLRSTAVDLAVPTARSVRNAICTSTPERDSTGVIVGHLQSAAPEQPMVDGLVITQWSELTFANGQLTRTIRERKLKPAPGGWFAACGIPLNTSIAILASAGADSSAIIRAEMTATGLLRRELYVGAARSVVVEPPAADSSRSGARRFQRGDGRLTGVIRDAGSRKPLPGVQVTVDATGLSTTTGDDGSFRLANLPLGTRVLLARKVGFMPIDQPVHIFTDGALTADVALEHVGNVLDTVRTVARRVFSLNDEGFAQRKARGSGYFFDAARIDSLQPFDITDMLWRVPSVRIERSEFTKDILLPKLFGGRCKANLYLNGARFSFMSAHDLDMMARPQDVLGVEVYLVPALAPQQFSEPGSECGSIVVWTR